MNERALRISIRTFLITIAMITTFAVQFDNVLFLLKKTGETIKQTRKLKFECYNAKEIHQNF